MIGLYAEKHGRKLKIVSEPYTYRDDMGRIQVEVVAMTETGAFLTVNVHELSGGRFDNDKE